jgi:hypothetical protein
MPFSQQCQESFTVAALSTSEDFMPSRSIPLHSCARLECLSELSAEAMTSLAVTWAQVKWSRLVFITPTPPDRHIPARFPQNTCTFKKAVFSHLQLARFPSAAPLPARHPCNEPAAERRIPALRLHRPVTLARSPAPGRGLAGAAPPGTALASEAQPAGSHAQRRRTPAPARPPPASHRHSAG